MKKLMITLSAAVLAFGAFADGAFIAGDNFNGKALTDLTAWSGLTDDTAAISATPYSFSQEGTVGAPNEYREVAASDNLTLKTPFNSPASYTLSASGYSIPGQLYFDSLVKFTACDEAPGDYDGAKLIVWIKEEDDASQKLMITAGKITSDGPVRQDYECGAPSDYDIGADGDWCRLTIKAVADITDGDIVPGFVVFVNGKAVTITTPKDIGIDGTALTKVMALWKKSNQLFPSLVAQDATVKAVCFAGQGAVDDVCFTTVEPNNNITDPATEELTEFAKDPVPAIATVDGVECATPEAINAALASADGSKIVVVELADAMTFSNEKGMNFAVGEGVESANFYLDLKGQTITAGEECSAITVAENCTLTITNSVPGGKVVGLVDNANGGLLNIQDGTFDGTIYAPEETCYITGGAFLASENADLPDLASFDPNMGLVQEGDYLVVAQTSIPKHFFIYVVDNVAVSNEYEEGQAITPPGNPTPAKDWETFVGWQPAVPATMGTADITVTAQFKFLDQDANNNYLVTSEADLIKVQKAVAGDATLRAASYLQTADITLSAAFDGIGQRDMKDTLGSDLAAYTSAKVFKGTYDGGNKTVSGVILKTGDYIGFFNSCYGATIKNLNISLGNATGWSDTTSGQVGAVFAGVTVNTTLENCQTIVAGGNDTFKASKTAAGFVGYAANGTVISNCVNNLNIWSAGNEKAGGFIACAQAGKSTGNGVEINGCSNLGDVKNNGSNAFIGGFVGYIDNFAVTFKGANVVQGTITPSSGYAKSLAAPNGGTVAVATGATFTVPAGIKTVSDGKAVDGLIYATVDGNVATLVKASALAAGGTYKVMATGGAPVIELAKGQTISFNTELAGINATGITAASGCKIEATGAGQPITYTAVQDGGWNPDVDPSVTAASMGITGDLSVVSFKDLSTWAQDNGVEFKAGDMDAYKDAFLLNCAPAAVESEREAFKVTAITQEEDGSWTVNAVNENTDGKPYYGNVVIKGSETLEDPTWDATNTEGPFFKAFLEVKPAPVE